MARSRQWDDWTITGRNVISYWVGIMKKVDVWRGKKLQYQNEILKWIFLEWTTINARGTIIHDRHLMSWLDNSQCATLHFVLHSYLHDLTPGTKHISSHIGFMALGSLNECRCFGSPYASSSRSSYPREDLKCNTVSDHMPAAYALALMVERLMWGLKRSCHQRCHTVCWLNCLNISRRLSTIHTVCQLSTPPSPLSDCDKGA